MYVYIVAIGDSDECHAHAPSGKKNGSHSSNAGAASTPPAPTSQSEVFAWRRPRLRWIHGAVHPVSTLHAPQPASASEAHTSHFSKSKARKKAPSSSGRAAPGALRQRRRDAVEALGVPAGDRLLGEDEERVVGGVADDEEGVG